MVQFLSYYRGEHERDRWKPQPVPLLLCCGVLMSRVYETRGRSREAAAAHVGVGLTKFDEMVADGRMPEPRVIDARVVWDVYELDEHFERLPRRGAAPQSGKSRSDPWARMAA